MLAGLREWLGRVDPDEVAERLRARTWAQVRPEPVAPLASSAAATALTADTRPAAAPPVCAAPCGTPTDGRVTLLAGRRSHSFPGEVREALAALLAAGELKVGDLPGLDADGPADAGPAAGHRRDRHRRGRAAARGRTRAALGRRAR